MCSLKRKRKHFVRANEEIINVGLINGRELSRVASRFRSRETQALSSVSRDSGRVVNVCALRYRLKGGLGSKRNARRAMTVDDTQHICIHCIGLKLPFNEFAIDLTMATLMMRITGIRRHNILYVQS